ncbi:MAG: hypothetical protein ACFFDN_27990, partial [Candidatus Hodarchaeota archaeon]
KNSVFIHLKCSYEELSRRRGLIVEPKESSIFQSRIYDKLAEYLEAITIDTSNLKILDTHNIIINYLFKTIKVIPINHEIMVSPPKHSLKV